jgi:hypothetical protein
MAVTNDLTLIHACDAVTDATTSHVLSSTGGGAIKTVAGDEIEPRQGTGCYGVDLDVETLYFNIAHASTSWNLTSSTIYAWFAFYTASYLDTWTNGAVTCRLLDASSNYSEWYLGGSGNLGSAWQRLCFSTSTTPDAVSGTLSISAVTNIRFYFTGVTKSKLAENVLMDFVHYAADGTGITITGGTSGTPETFDDIYGDDDTAAIGLFFETDGIYFMNGPITFGDSGGTSDMYFKDTNKVVGCIGRYRSFTTTNRTSAETLLASSHYDITVEGNATGTHSFVLGDATGTNGYNGCTITSGGSVITPNFSVGNANMDTFDLYGCTFTGLGTTTLVNDSSHHVYSCNFSGCGQIEPVGAPVIRNCNFVATTDTGGALLWNNSIDVQSSVFIANTTGAGVEHDDWNGTDSGTCTNTGSETTTMHDSGGGLSSANVNDIVYNETDLSWGRITVVDSDTQITHTALSGGTNNYWTNADAYSIATPYSYTDLTFTGNTYDVNNSTSPANVVGISKAGTSNPATYPSGDFVAIQGSVSVTITVKDVAGVVIQNAQTGVFATDDGTEILNADTNASGIASTTYAGATPREVKVWIRKASSGSTKYKNYSSVQNISASGLTLDVTLVEDPNNNATS